MNAELMIEQAEGKPAPEPLLAVQAFANTLDVEDSIDHLESTESFRRWLAESGLARRGVRVKPGELIGTQELRKAVRRLLVANTRERTDRKAAAALGRLASKYRIPLAADESGTLKPDLTPVTEAEDLVPQLLAVIFYAQTTETWPRLKLCENLECVWAFYDSSRNRSGSWCRSGQCGNRLKNRAWRARHRND